MALTFSVQTDEDDMVRKKRWFPVLLSLGVFASQLACGERIAWVDWQIPLAAGLATGRWGDGVQVQITGPIEFEQVGFGQFVGTLPYGDTRVPFTNYWTEGSPPPYTGNALVSNAPTPYELVALDLPGTTTVTFSEPVIKPLMAILSLGAAETPVTYSFDTPFTLLSGGQGYWGSGTATVIGNTITGSEFHGVIQFEGTVSSISWTSTPEENWNGFTIGLACYVPDGETTTFSGSWDPTYPTVAVWNATLNSSSGLDFSGRTIREIDAGFGIDTCWFPGSSIELHNSIPDTSTTVDNNMYIDRVGWAPHSVTYYRANGRASCGFVFHQQVQMQCPDGSFKNFGNVNILSGGIRATSVTSSRAGLQASRRWP